ncbi:MAG: TetR/AcrR family transcriptional regulator [Myxococcota bacterium]|nr:TetR/AcrR family transcriptional regulator [Myxococcota bacterium]
MAQALPAPRQARSRATRQRLLEATLAAILELGLARASTPEVCRRAGVSQGALFKHFASKATLIAAATEHLFGRLVEDFRRAFAEVADEPDRVAAAVCALAAVFREPRLAVAFELYVAARTDEELHAALAPVLARHRENLHAEARALFPEAARAPRFLPVVDAVVDALQGAAGGALVLPAPASEARRLDELVAYARRELAVAQA